MIEFQKAPYPDAAIKRELHPLVIDWFFSRFPSFSEPQTFSLLNIRRRINTLISSPTGSGKTLSAFLSILSELIRASIEGTLEDRTYCVYISPLKALTRDIERNLKEPLTELERLYAKPFGIRIAVRTGDTTPHERSKMLKKPPHIFITTPESLAIVVSTKKFSENFKKIEWVIVDEIHALADSKRGVHLSLSIERLAQSQEPCRIGLSATISPLNEIARYLVGSTANGEERDCKIVDVSFLKKMNLSVLTPVDDLMTTDYFSSHKALYSLLDQLIQDHTTTLIFTNTRSGTERVVHHLKECFPGHYEGIDLGDDDDLAPLPQPQEKKRQYIGAHHGSLSKELRHLIENKLKSGDLKAVVCSTSLELGIDIGFIDLVILLGSPKSVARALQRIGRSGHRLHDTAQGKIIVLDRDDLVECSVLLKNAIEKKIDTVHIPKNCLDVLAQHVVGCAVASPEPLEVSELYRLCKQSYCYRTLSYHDFLAIILYLAGHYASLEERNVYGKIWFDEKTNMIGKRGKFARVLYMTNVGTIPDETNVRVKILKKGEEGFRVGTITEGFLEKIKRGDIFVLGGATYEFLYAQGLTVFVKASEGRTPTVPSWFSEMLPLSYELALDIGKFRRHLNEHFESRMSREDILKFIRDVLYVDKRGTQEIYAYLKEQHDYAKIPHDRRIVIEHFSERGKKYCIFHALYGRRVNDVLSRAVAFIAGKLSGSDCELGINDNGFYLASAKPIQARRALSLVSSKDLQRIMELSLEKTEVLGRRFRHCAARALMILRQYKGTRKSVGRQQMSSRMLIAAVKRIDPDFPILKEAKREVLEDLMDIGNATKVITGIEHGEIAVEEIFTDIPSPFAFNLIAQGYADIMKMEDKYEFLKRMHEMVLLKIDLKKKRM